VPTLRDFAKKYAAEIRNASLVYEVKTASSSPKVASASARQTILGVFNQIGALTSDGEALTGDQVAELLLEIDDELEVAPGTMQTIKEGSVKALLQLDTLVMQLMQAMAKR